MINPMQIFDAMRRGVSAGQFVRELAMQDPRAAQAAQIIEGKSPAQLEEIARNMARERGIDLDQAVRQMMGR